MVDSQFWHSELRIQSWEKILRLVNSVIFIPMHWHHMFKIFNWNIRFVLLGMQFESLLNFSCSTIHTENVYRTVLQCNHCLGNLKLALGFIHNFLDTSTTETMFSFYFWSGKIHIFMASLLWRELCNSFCILHCLIHTYIFSAASGKNVNRHCLQ